VLGGVTEVNTFNDLGQLFYLQRRHLNHSMLLFVRKVSIQIAMLHRVTSVMHLLKEIEFDIFLVADSSFSSLEKMIHQRAFFAMIHLCGKQLDSV
jgi:hypothetical protein